MIPYRMQRLMMYPLIPSARRMQHRSRAHHVVQRGGARDNRFAPDSGAPSQSHSAHFAGTPSTRLSGFRALTALPIILAATMASAVYLFTSWIIRHGAERAGNSPALLFGTMLVYTLTLVTVIRLTCLTAVLVSAERHKEALALMPVQAISQRILGELHPPDQRTCKRIGYMIGFEAAMLLAVLFWSTTRFLAAH